MKNLMILFAILTVSSLSHASSITVECSNPQGTIRTVDGLSDNNLILTEYRYGNGELDKNEITLKLRNMKVTEVKSTQLFEDSHNNCHNGMAVMSHKSIYHSQVRYENADGSLFSKDVSGVTPDQKAVEAFLICERFISNIMPCNSAKD